MRAAKDRSFQIRGELAARHNCEKYTRLPVYRGAGRWRAGHSAELPLQLPKLGRPRKRRWRASGIRGMRRRRLPGRRRRAVEAGVKLGRRSSLSAYQQAEVIKGRAESSS